MTSLNNVSLQMHRGEILAVIGPNGAGKTSLFNSLTGVYTPQEGSIDVRARAGDSPTSVIGLKTHLVNRLGSGPDVPEHPAVPGADRAGERQGRHRDPPEGRPDLGDARVAAPAPGGAGEHRACLRAAAPGRAGTAGQRHRRLAGLRRAAPARDRPGAGHLAGGDPAGRAGRRHQPGREARAGDPDPEHQRRRRRQRAADRARHETGDVDRAPDHRAQLRREDRRGHAGADPA